MESGALSETQTEVATVIKRTVNSAVVEMWKQAREACRQRQYLSWRVTSVGGREALLCKSDWLKWE